MFCDNHKIVHVLILLFVLSIIMMLSHHYVIILNIYLLMKVFCGVEISQMTILSIILMVPLESSW
jgi:hypothetical protein